MAVGTSLAMPLVSMYLPRLSVVYVGTVCMYVCIGASMIMPESLLTKSDQVRTAGWVRITRYVSSYLTNYLSPSGQVKCVWLQTPALKPSKYRCIILRRDASR